MPVEPPPADWGLLARPSEPAPLVFVMARSPSRARWYGGAAVIAAALGATLAVALSGGSSTAGPRAVGTAINLRAADLPGFGVASSDYAPARTAFASLAAVPCLAGAGTAVVPSPSFQTPGGPSAEFVQSSVGVASSPAAAATDLRRVQQPGVAACIAGALDRTVADGGQTVVLSGASARSQPFSPAGGGFDYVATVTVTDAGTDLPMSVEVRGFVAGRTEVTLTTAALSGPFPPTLQSSISSLLVNRALAINGATAPARPSSPPAAPAAPAAGSGTVRAG